jgi:hypothetical protein
VQPSREFRQERALGGTNRLGEATYLRKRYVLELAAFQRRQPPGRNSGQAAQFHARATLSLAMFTSPMTLAN